MSVNRLVKLKAMSAGEIAYRLKYRAYPALERGAHARGSLAPADRLRAALVPQMAKRADWKEALAAAQCSDRFFGWQDDANGFRELYGSQFSQELAKARRIADDAASHVFTFFGETLRMGPEIKWHADPVTGAEWPRQYHRDVPVNGGNIGYGDVKHVWELNRHQFFVDLAKIAFLENSRRHADALHSMLRSWQAAVPYATGVPWACALEPAFRAYSWLWAYHLVRAAGMVDRDTHHLWLTGLYDHGRFLHRHLERYASPYNHLIGEAAALFALGVMMPEIREAAAWVERGKRVLESTVHGQFHADGGSVEQSTFYHHATLGFYLLSVILGRRANIEFTRDVHQAIEKALEFSMALMQPDGRLPRIGGADDGKPIRMEHLRFWDFRPYYAVGAVLFSRADFKFAAARFWEDAFWLLGTDGLRAFETLEAAEPRRAAPLSSSGYYVVRSDWSASADYLCFDCGEQAAGLRRDEVPSAAHGHADCLSVVLTLAGREVLVDPGFFCYNGDPRWEVHFRKTAAHNTLTVDARDQARHVSKMAWTHTYAAHPEGWSADGALAWVRGSHDGYARYGASIVHRRTAWLRDEGYVVMLDELSGSGAHAVTANFQFAPGIVQKDGPAAVLFNDRFELAWTATAPIESSIVAAGDNPADGWIATSLGVREPAPRLALNFTLSGGYAALLTIVADRHRGIGLGRRVELAPAGHPLSACVRGRGTEDGLYAAGQRSESHPIETDAPLVAVRTRAGAVIDVARVGGTYARPKSAVLADPLAQAGSGGGRF
jgi:hypothetical protein